MSPTRPIHILMVCTGNICRSPMAEVIAADYATARGRPVEVQSGSVLGLDGRAAHKNAIKVVKEQGLDLSEHRSQPLTDELIGWADHILVMEIRHAAEIRERYPQADERIMLLGTFGGLIEIDDPLGGWKGRFRTCRDDIRRCVETFVDRLPTGA